MNKKHFFTKVYKFSKKFFSKILTRKKIKKEFLDFVNKYDYIISGTYYILWDSKPLLCHKNYIKQTSFTRKEMFSKSLKICIHKKNILYEGKCILRTRNNKFKVFNYENQTILSLGQSDNEIKAELYFQPYLPSTIISLNNSYRIDKIIKHSNRLDWNNEEIEKKYLQIIDDLSLYYNSCKYSRVNSLQLINECVTFKNKLPQLYKKYLSLCKYQGTVSVVFCHGDLHFSNVLFENHKRYYIDYEYSRNDIFFIDIFNCFFVDFCDNNCSLLITKYLQYNKTFIDGLSVLFKKLGMELSNDYIRDYLVLFVIRRFEYELKQNIYLLNKQYLNYLEKKYDSFIKFIFT